MVDGPPQVPSPSPRRWRWAGIAAIVLLVVVAGWFVKEGCEPPPPPETLEQILARHLEVPLAQVHVNLPPRPRRYPGALVDGEHGMLHAAVAGDDAALIKGQPSSFRHSYEGRGHAHGAVGAAVFEAVLENRRDLQTTLVVPDLRVVEMTVPDLVQRVRAAAGEADIPEYLTVVYRACEGHLTYELRRKERMSGSAWLSFKAMLGRAADAEGKVEYEAGAGGEDVVTITTTDPVVVAFVACRASDVVVTDSPGTPPPEPVEVRASTPDAGVAVSRLLERRPEQVPALEQALREIGSPAEVDEALLEVVRVRGEDDPRSVRARRLLDTRRIEVPRIREPGGLVPLPPGGSD